MNIDDLTLGQIKQIQNMLLPSHIKNDDDSFIGKYCIIRTCAAGVHAGTLVSQIGDVVVLKDSRRLWSWIAADGIALSGVAQHGLRSVCKIDSVNPDIRLTGCIETIPVSEKARVSIHEYK